MVQAREIAQQYKYGFSTNVETEEFPSGLNEEIVALISKKRGEPEWVLDFRLKALSQFRKMKEPRWAGLDYPPIDYQAMTYYSAPKKKEKISSLSEADPEVLKTFQRLGIPFEEQARLLNLNVATDMVFDSVSIMTTFQEELKKAGVILCSISEAILNHEDLVRKYLASVVPIEDNFFVALNSAVFSDGSFVYIPKGVHCPRELSTYFRINDKKAGQFERTLIIADDDSYVSYLEGCTAPAYDTNQLHAAVVELVANKNAHIKYSTVQNWYAGDSEGKGGIYNFVTKRGLCEGADSKISWVQVEAGAAISWKYPSCILKGDRSQGEFYSCATTAGKMQADTGSKMIHIGEETKSTIISKGIAADSSSNRFRGLVWMGPKAKGARNFTQCDSLISGKDAEAHTYPCADVNNSSAIVEHEATTGRLSQEELFFLQARGLSLEEAIKLAITGFAEKVLIELPLEFAQEAKNLLAMKLEARLNYAED